MNSSLRFLLGSLCLLVCLLTAAHESFSLDVPPLKGRVNDLAGLLSGTEQNSLETMLRNFEAQTTNQLVLLTLPSLEGDSLEDFSIRVAEQWKIGQKGRDNGAILVIFAKDRKVRFEGGYGLEGALTDAECSRIIRHMIAPAFRRGDYYGGIRTALNAAMMITKGEGSAVGTHTRPVHGRRAKSQASGLLFFLIMLLFAFSRFGRFFLLGSLFGGGMWGGRGYGGRGTGGFGGGGGSFGGGGASGGW